MDNPEDAASPTIYVDLDDAAKVVIATSLADADGLATLAIGNNGGAPSWWRLALATALLALRALLKRHHL